MFNSFSQHSRLSLSGYPNLESRNLLKKRKASNGAGKFAVNLCKCKYSDYDVQNCKSGRHNRRHSFKRHSPRHRPCLSNNTYKTLTVEGRNRYTLNSHHGQTQLVRADLSYQDDIIRRSTRFKPPLLHSNEFDMNYNHLSVDLTHTDHSILNFPPQFTSNQVDSTTDLFDKVVLTEVVIRPTEKPRSVHPHKSILKKNGNKRKSSQENKKFRSVCKPIYEATVDQTLFPKC